MSETQSNVVSRRVRLSRILMAYGDTSYPYESREPGVVYFKTESGAEFNYRAHWGDKIGVGTVSFDIVQTPETPVPDKEIPRILNTIGKLFLETLSEAPHIKDWIMVPSSPRRFSIYKRWLERNLPPGYGVKEPRGPASDYLEVVKQTR